MLAEGPVGAQDRAYDQAVLEIQTEVEANHLDAAEKLIIAAERKYAHNGGIENLLGVVEIQKGNPAEASKAFSAAIADNPRLLAPYLNLSRLKMPPAATDKQVRAQALRLSLRALQLDPQNEEAHYQAATIFFWNKDYAASLEHLNRLSRDGQKKIGAEALFCSDNAALGLQSSTTESVRALTANPDLTEQDADTCLSPLRTARRADLIDQLFTALAAHNTLSPQGTRILGLAQEAVGKLADARATLEKAFAVDDQSVQILEDLTRVAKAAGDNQGALGYLAHARALQPDQSELAYEFGVICVRMGLFAEARKAIADALRLKPDDPDYNLSMGMVVSYSEDPSQALPYLTRYHALQPKDAEGVLALGTANFRAKDYDAAEPWLRQAASNTKTASDAHFYLGRIARQRGNLDEATAEIRQSLALHPDQPDALAELGQITLAAHDTKQAEDLFGRALRKDPDNYAANFGLLQLYARTGDPRREQQSHRFDEIKNLKEERDRQMMRVIEVKPNKGPANQ